MSKPKPQRPNLVDVLRLVSYGGPWYSRRAARWRAAERFRELAHDPEAQDLIRDMEQLRKVTKAHP